MNAVLFLLMSVGYIAAWWLAVDIMGGYRLVELEWVPVAFAAFAVPMMIADSLYATGWNKWALGAWFVTPLVIDAVWLIRRALRMRRGTIG